MEFTMRKFLVAAAAAFVTTTGANAAVLDFVAEAANNERGVEDGTTITFGAVDVTFNAVNGFAYFDDVSSGPGGLGVCTTLEDVMTGGLTFADQCDPTSDDSISIDDDGAESVEISFANAINLSNHTFNDFAHNDISNRDDLTLLINIDGAGFTSITFADAAALALIGVTSVAYAVDTAATGTGFYVASVVAPLPAAAPFLITGLAGLGFASRRKRSA